MRLSIEKSIGDLPAMPATANAVLVESNDPDSTVARLEKIIHLDQAITSKVLRVVNSSYYGYEGEVSSISQACLMLGIQQIKALVLSMTLFSMLEGRTPHQQAASNQVWLHAMASTACVNLIATKKHLKPSDTGFLLVASLLHDIGRLLLFASFIEEYDAVMEKALAENISLDLVEMQVLGTTHGRIGSQMARGWNLPEKISQIIDQHEGNFSQQPPWEVFPVHIADCFTQYLYKNPAEPERLPVAQLALDWIGLDQEELDLLYSETLEKVTEFENSEIIEAA